MQRLALALLVAAAMLLPAVAGARETEHLYPARHATESAAGQQHLIDVPFYSKGQAHPGVEKALLHVTMERSTRGAFRSDQDSCDVAFLSALRALQDRAQQEGADAIVDIVSTTRGKQTESATDYRCVAGSIVVHVGLKGTFVKLQ